MESFMNEPDAPHQGLSIGSLESSYLSEAAVWAKFIAIVGFIGCGFLILISFFAGSIFSKISDIEGTSLPPGTGAALTLVYLLIGILYFFPCYYLYKFATKAKQAIQMHDQMALQDSFRNIKSCFKFVGIMTLVALAMYGIAIIAMSLGATIFS